MNVGSIPAGRQSVQPLSWSRPSAPRRGFAEAEARFGFDLAETLSTRPGLDDALAPHDPPDPRAEMPTLGVPIAQIFDTYILARAEDGALILVDQHAAHERLTEERLRDERERGGIARQALLSPVPVDLPEDDVARLLDETEALGRLGLEIESFGPGAVLVRALPAAIGRADPGELLRDIADTLAETGTATALEARLDAVLARMACHRSIRAGRRLAGPEMIALLRDMAATPRAQTCPHGRPTVIRLGRDDIELLFGRR